MSLTNEKNAHSRSDSEKLTYATLCRFFIPLGMTPMLFASTHSIVIGALARLPAPEVNLAVYSVVQGVVNAVKAPCLASMQVTASLIQNRTTYRSVMPLIWAVCAVFTFLVGLLGFSPVGGFVLQNIIGLQDPFQISLAYTGMRIAILLPLAESLRNSLQGITIGLRSTAILPVGTTLRVIVITLFVTWAVKTQALTGIVVGNVAWASGIFIEGFIIVGYLIYRFKTLENAASFMPDRGGGDVTPGGFLKFFTPLGLTMSITALIPPVIQAGIARSFSPIEALAAFGVAFSIRTVLSGPLQVLHHSALVYVQGLNDPRFVTVRRFCLAVGGALSTAFLIVSFTKAGPWLVGTVLGVQEDLQKVVLDTCAVFSFFPIIAAWREAYWGVLLSERRTAMIGGAKVANLTTVVAAAALGFGPLQNSVSIHSAVIGAFAFTLGEAVEAIVVRYHAAQKPTETASRSLPVK